MTSFSNGRRAEQAAAEFLTSSGYEVLQKNWRTRYCEIDIVATKNNTVYLVEVKYRQNSFFGDGLDYISPKKLKQMELAGRFWTSEHNYGGDYCLAAVEVSGNFEVTEFISDLS